MPVISRDQFRVNVVLYPEEGMWIAQGIEFDITARGHTPTEASERFNDKFGAELVMSIEIGDETPLAGVTAAPKEFWEMYKTAKMRAELDDTSFRLSDGATPNIHQNIRIADKRDVA